jgi:hypothetical protein
VLIDDEKEEIEEGGCVCSGRRPRVLSNRMIPNGLLYHFSGRDQSLGDYGG